MIREIFEDLRDNHAQQTALIHRDLDELSQRVQENGIEALRDRYDVLQARVEEANQQQLLERVVDLVEFSQKMTLWELRKKEEEKAAKNISQQVLAEIEEQKVKEKTAGELGTIAIIIIGSLTLAVALPALIEATAMELLVAKAILSANLIHIHLRIKTSFLIVNRDKIEIIKKKFEEFIPQEISPELAKK